MQKQVDLNLSYDLKNPNYSVYHRVALGGLASTIKAWGSDSPEDIRCIVSDQTVEISWPKTVSDTEALRRILKWSFRVSDDLLIDLPGQRFGERKDLQLVIHEGILHSFLQHPNVRKCETVARRITVGRGGTKVPLYLRYKPVKSNVHQNPIGTNLFRYKHRPRFPKSALILQWMVPGAFTGATTLDGSPADVILLLFLIVGCSFFLVRPIDRDPRRQICLTLPDVSNLNEFCEQKRLTNSAENKSIKSSTYEGRIVGGSEVAAYRMLFDAQKISPEAQLRPRICNTITMGAMPWDSHQMYRTEVREVDLLCLEQKLFQYVEN